MWWCSAPKCVSPARALYFATVSTRPSNIWMRIRIPFCIVSGGKGPNEPFPEAQGMADYLKEHGIDEQRILEEPDSKTTEENIVNSKKLISDDDASVGVITNNFHMFRALQIADKYGLDNAQGIAAGSPPNMLVNNMVREFFAEIKFLL